MFVNDYLVAFMNMNEHPDRQNTFDIIVIGGGINGAGIAADAAGRGLSVLLCEKGDLANATSSRSSKLIHGGLRYLEHYEFKLVRDALAEREVLLKKAPHIMWPLRFRLPHQSHLRPAWMIRMGLFLYDHLAKREMLPGSRKVSVTSNNPLVDSISTCFEYSDGWVDDARLVVLNALQAEQHGAEIAVHTQCISAKRHADKWEVDLIDTTGQARTVYAKTVVNAAGPWAAHFINDVVNSPKKKSMRLVKGSHIVVNRLYPSDEAYILQNKDGRIVFAIPYEDDFTLVGTTDEDYLGDPNDVKISDDEVDYIVDIANEYFKQPISKDEIVHAYSGVRPLLDEENTSAQELSRDYQIKIEGNKDSAILVNIFGGKITTYRKLAEQAVDSLCKTLKLKSAAWTANTPLPGGDFVSKEALLLSLQQLYPFLATPTLVRYVRTYGTLCHEFLQGKIQADDLGIHFGHGLYQAEIDYLCTQEWAFDVDTILWRRTKLGLKLDQSQKLRLQHYIDTLALQHGKVDAVSQHVA